MENRRLAFQGSEVISTFHYPFPPKLLVQPQNPPFPIIIIIRGFDLPRIKYKLTQPEVTQTHKKLPLLIFNLFQNKDWGIVLNFAL